MNTTISPSTFPTLVQNFFCKRLSEQQNASPRTIATYRDTFRLLLQYLEERLKKNASAISLRELNAPNVLAFLNYLEQVRHNSIRTRNARLAAIRAFLKYSALHDPTALPTIQCVLAIPMKRFGRPYLGFLSRHEVEVILKTPNTSTWSGQRDQVLFATLYNTGARVSEIISLRVADVSLDSPACVRIEGKGRKQRIVPLWRSTAKRIKQWLRFIDKNPQSPLFPNAARQFLTRSGVEYRLQMAVRSAAKQCTTLKNRRISPHTFRHTTAMHLLQSGVDLTVIALWLGHESPETTHMYMEADLSMKRNALKKIYEPCNQPIRFRPSDKLLLFLESL